MDADQNRAREDRVVITGLDRAPGGLTSHQQKKDHYSRVVGNLISVACVGVDPLPLITDVIVNLRREQPKPSVEVRIDSVTGAFTFRKSASALAKAKTAEFGTLFFSNSVTLATRVRIEIMRCIAKKLTTESEVAFVQGFISRPAMKYEARDPAISLASGTGRSYNFVDFVSRFGDLVSSVDLAPAYRRAGTTFNGALEQYFVVLNDVRTPSLSGGNQVPIGTAGGRGGQGGRGGPAPRARGTKRLGGFTRLSPSKRHMGSSVPSSSIVPSSSNV